MAGYLGAGDRAYLEEQRRLTAGWPHPARFEYVGEVTRAEKIAFLQSLDVFCLPTVYAESKGLSLFEAWANALPAVVPEHGTFPELVAATGAGILFPPADPTALADCLRRLLLEPELAGSLGERGQAAVRERYHSAAMARQTVELYGRLLAASGVDTPRPAPVADV